MGRAFVLKYWFDGDQSSKSVTDILGWIENGKLTLSGRNAYKKLVKNLNR